MLHKLFALSTLAAAVALAGCNSDDSKSGKDNPEPETSIAEKPSIAEEPSITVEDIDSFAELALTVQPHLPLNIKETVDNLFENPNQPALPFGGSSQPAEGNLSKTAINPEISVQQPCQQAGEFIAEGINYETTEDGSRTLYQSASEFDQCTFIEGDYLTIVDGALDITAERQLTADLSQVALIDTTVELTEFSLSVTTGNETFNSELQGQLGWSYMFDPARGSSTELTGGSGTLVLNTPEENASITFTEFGSVLESSAEQQVQYLSGSVTYTNHDDDTEHDYTITTITPFGIVNGLEQGLVEVVSGISKVVMSYQGQQQWYVELDNDGDGEIDHSQLIELQ